MVAYELYLPLSAAGYGLGRGVDEIWPNGLLVFVFHMTLAALLGMLTLIVLRFRPRKLFGYALPVLLGAVSLAAILLLSGLGNILGGFLAPRPAAMPTLTPAPTIMPAAFWTPTPGPSPTPVVTTTATLVIPPTATPSQTPTVRPTPVYALISASSGGGALLRSEPNGGFVVTALLNDYLVEVLPDTVEVNNVTWYHVRTADGIEGWVLDSVLSRATPAPAATP
jgi:hypothetical protein